VRWAIDGRDIFGLSPRLKVLEKGRIFGGFCLGRFGGTIFGASPPAIFVFSRSLGGGRGSLACARGGRFGPADD